MQVEFSAQYISAEDLERLSTVTLDASVENGFEPFGRVNLKPLTKPATDSFGSTHFELQVTRTLLRQVDTMHVFSAARGYRPEQAKDKLMTVFSLRKEPKIVMTPPWWPWLPLIPFNISVENK
jgi:hypothetical protein